MKSLPENEWFDALGKRLRNYSEVPDDEVWDKITGAKPARDPKWVVWTCNTAAVVSGLAFLFLIYVNHSAEENMERKLITQNSDTPEIQNSNLNSVGESDRLAKANKEGQKTFNQLPGKSSLLRFEPRQNDFRKSDFSRGTNLKVDFRNNETVNADLINQPVAVKSVLDTSDGSLEKSKPEAGTVEVTSISEKTNSDTAKVPGSTQDSVKAEKKKLVAEKKKKVKNDMTFYMMISPSLSYQRVIPMTNDNIVVTEFTSAPVLSGQRFGISFEAGIQGGIVKRLEYYGGFSYYQQNQTLSYQYQSGDGTSIESTDNSMNFTVNPGEHQKDVTYDMKNIGVQAGLLYYLKGDRLTHKIGGGLSFQRGLKKAETGETYDNSQSMYLFYQLLYRTEYTINDRMTVFFQPSFGHAFYSNEKLSEPFKLKPYRAAFGFGLLYQF